jgi:signal transduction histidine kinase
VTSDLRRLLGYYGLTVATACFAVGALVQNLVSPTVVINSTRFDRGSDAVIAGTLCAVVVLVALRGRLGISAPLSALVLLGISSIAAQAWMIDSPFMYLLATLLCGMTGYMATGRMGQVSLIVLFAVGSFIAWERPLRNVGTWLLVLVYLSIAWVVGGLIRRQLAREQDAAVAEERRRLARELHDVIAHSVSVMTVQTGAVRRLLRPEQERERDALLSVERTGREALAEMRRLVGLLKEEDAGLTYAPQPGIRTLDSLLGTVRDAGLPVELEVEGKQHELPPGLDLTAFRVVQESLTNALKYAGPARAWVRVLWSDDALRIEVENDGRDAGSGKGHGQAGMRERVGLYGGRLETGPRAGGGYVVRAYLPIGGDA